jgi:hypothetical protein
MVLSGLQTHVAGALAVKNTELHDLRLWATLWREGTSTQSQHFSKTIQYVLHRVLLLIRQLTSF